MKRISILTLLLCVLALGGYAATLSGTVTNATTSAPVSGQKVYAYDSLGFWLDSTVTNSSGGYSFTIPSAVPTGDFLMAHTKGCGGSLAWWNGWFAGSNMTANFTTCTGTTYAIHGTVSLGGIANTGQAQIYLIHKYYDSLSASNVLTAVDSFLTSATGGSFAKSYTVIPGGALLLKAALLPSHPSYASFLPTYYTSSASWSSATGLSSGNFGTTASNINMIAGTNPGGPGFIGGQVIMGANKTAGVGDPLPSRILILANASNQPVAYTYSDANGRFEFKNIALGSYKIYGDAWGKTNPALSVTLGATTKAVHNVIFEENSSTFMGRLGDLSTGNAPALAGLNVYPNPVTAFVQIDGLATVKGDKTVTVRGMNGAVISSQTVNTASARIATAELPAGMYILQVATDAGSASFRFVK